MNKSFYVPVDDELRYVTYDEFKEYWKSKKDYCRRFLWDSIRHAKRNMYIECDYSDDDSNGCKDGLHPSYYGCEFYKMVTNYKQLMEAIF